MRRLLACALLPAALFHAAPVAAADIFDYFAMYYRQEVAARAYDGPLDFLSDAAAAHGTSAQLLEVSASRAVTLDPRIGYLRIDDSSDTDQILTVAVYPKADGDVLLFVGGSNCADGCSFSAQLFSLSADRLRPVPLSAVIPAIEPAEFISRGHPMPKMLTGLTPSIDYVPDRTGSKLTVRPWYGYEVEEQMDAATRGRIRNLVLSWDRAQERFTKPDDDR